MPDKHPAYVTAEVGITDPNAFKDYVAKAVPTLVEYNARFVARSQAHSKEGTAPVGEIVVLGFDSLGDAERRCGSPSYSACIPMRQRAANKRLFIIEGEPL